MKETGLMFKAPLVRSILDGKKTQTRRIAKDVKHPGWGNVYTPSVLAREPQHTLDAACPYGGPGDRIYVRETWNWFDPQEIPADRAGPRAPFTGIAGGVRPIEWVAAFAADGPLPYPGYGGRDHWRPSIHMPKWAARIWLDITGVRLERLQDISAADAKAEGIEGQFANGPWRNYQRDGYWFPEGKDIAPILSFHSLWESTGGDWYANPWVWAIDFKRAQAQKEQP